MVVVFASGFFDPIHRGHIYYLRDAKKLGDFLIVHIHRDECCVKKKGYVFMPLEDRVEVLKAIRYVDAVIICGRDCDMTVAKALEKIKPDIFAKGGDRKPENMPKKEIEVCNRLGIKIVYGVGGRKVQSSSKLVKQAIARIGTT